MATHEEGGSPRWLKWGLVALVGLPLLCIGSGLLAFLYMRSESPYEDAVARATSHGRVNKALGAPVSANFLFTGKVQSKGNDAIALLEIGLSGSTQDGTLYVPLKSTGPEARGTPHPESPGLPAGAAPPPRGTRRAPSSPRAADPT